jgi:DNA polymerase III epsilon subunit-like protein
MITPEAPWRLAPMALIDVETTGIRWDQDRIVEVGFALIDNGAISTTHAWLLDPQSPFYAGAVAAHGITAKDVVGCPTFEQAVPEFVPLLQDRLPVAYNAGFDRNFLLSHVLRCPAYADAVPAFRHDVEWLDVLVWARAFLAQIPSRKLADVCQHFGIVPSTHRAKEDARAAAEVLLKLADQMPVSYADMMAEQKQRGPEQRFKAWSRYER